MSAADSKSQNDLILHEALEAKMLRAIEFADIVTQLEQADIPADEYLVAEGYITESQRAELIASVRRSSRADSTQSDVTLAGQSNRTQPKSHRSSDRISFSPGSFVARDSISQDESGTRYEWVEKFAQGGLGAVWRARDTTIDRKVALKEILPRAQRNMAAVEQFLVEARITGQLQHPGVVPIYDLGTNPDGRPFYVMKFVEGQTLHDAIRRQFDAEDSRAEWDAGMRRLLTIFVQVCRTMDYAHDQGFIHRDLKPRNIMLGDYGETLVVDWGLAMPIPETPADTVDIRDSKPNTSRSRSKSVGSKSAKPRSSAGQARQIVGTPAYLAPEQARGEVHEMDARSDVYSLGVVLFEILTGKTPFPGKDTNTIIDAVLSGEFPEPRKIQKQTPTALNSICLKAMQFIKGDRYESAKALADDVERFLGGQRVLAHPETRIEQAQRVLSKHRKATFGVVCGLGLLSVVIGIAALQIDQARHAEVQARFAAAKALRLERVAKDEAVAHLRSAIDAVDTWLLGLSGDLEFYPGLSQKRAEFLTRAADYYAQFADPESDDLVLHGEAARAAIRCGDALQLSNQPQESLQRFAAAIAFFRQEVLRNNSNLRAKKELANALIGKAIALGRIEDPSNHAQLAGDALSEARDILRQLALFDVDAASIQRAMARVEVATARWAQQQGQTANALRHFEAAKRILATEVEDSEIKPRYTALYHSVLFELTDLYLNQRNTQKAQRACLDALESFQLAMSRHPLRPDFIEGHMTAQILLGNAYEAAEDVDRALAAYEAAEVDHQKLLATLFQGEVYSENLVTAQVNRARLLRQQGEIEQAEGVLEYARALASRLVQTLGQRPRILRLFAATVVEHARTLADLEQFAAAEQGYSDAITVWEHLLGQGLATEDDSARLDEAKQQRQRLAEQRPSQQCPEKSASPKKANPEPPGPEQPSSKPVGKLTVNPKNGESATIP